MRPSTNHDPMTAVQPSAAPMTESLLNLCRTLPCVWNVVTAGLLEQHVLTVRSSLRLFRSCLLGQLPGPRGRL